MDSVLTYVNYDWFETHKGEPIAEMYGKISPQEYEDDLEKRAVKRPVMSLWWLILFFLLPIIGAIIILCVEMCYYPKKCKAYMNAVCDDFNLKYEKKRGVRIEQAKVESRTPKGAVVFVDGLKVTVKQPGVVLPNIQLFTPCRESAMAIQSYRASNDPNAAAVGSTPAAVSYSNGPYPTAAPGYGAVLGAV